MQPELTRNGRPASIEAEAGESLPHVLPERLWRRSTKAGRAPAESRGLCAVFAAGGAEKEARR